jgi:hypothetical protein
MKRPSSVQLLAAACCVMALASVVLAEEIPFEDVLATLTEELDLSDVQMTALEPIIGTGLRGTLSLVFENTDKRLSMPRKVSPGHSMNKIQSDMQ